MRRGLGTAGLALKVLLLSASFACSAQLWTSFSLSLVNVFFFLSFLGFLCLKQLKMRGEEKRRERRFSPPGEGEGGEGRGGGGPKSQVRLGCPLHAARPPHSHSAAGKDPKRRESTRVKAGFNQSAFPPTLFTQYIRERNVCKIWGIPSQQLTSGLLSIRVEKNGK